MAKKKALRPCDTPHCKNEALPKRKICQSCKYKKYVETDPVRVAWQHLKSNAKRRGIFFDLTLEQFREWCIETDYIAGKGRTKDSYSVDRMDESKGYTAGNLKLLTVSENSLKENERRKKVKKLNYDWQTKTAVVTEVQLPTGSDGPF